MISQQRLEELGEKSQGRFRLTVLIQKRLQEFIRNGEPIGSVGTSRAFDRSLKEIQEGAIALVAENAPPAALT